MVGAVSNALEYLNLNLDMNLKRHELPFLFNSMNETAKRVPQLTQAVINSFGKVLDVFEEPKKLRDPEFDHSNLVSYENYTNVQQQRYGGVSSQFESEFSTGNFNGPSPFNVEYLGKRTKAHYDRIESPQVTVDVEIDKERLKASASPCPEDLHLCGRCYVSLASVRCDTCNAYFCGVCANNVHSGVMNKTHALFTTKTDRRAQFYTGSLVQDNVDFSISLDKHSGFPMYDWCDSHPRQQLKFACVSCHFLPVCTLCCSEVHKAPGNNHKIVELELAVTEVKEFLGDCLSSLVDRHNGLSPVLPELDQLSYLSDVSVSSSNRSLNCAVQGVFDALKVKQMMVSGEIKNLQQVGSSNLNRLVNLSNVYNKYLLGKVEQLKGLMSLKDPGLALNAFVEVKANFEQLLYQCEDLPDLALEVPHWQLNVGNLTNLLSDVEYRINNRCEELNLLCNKVCDESNKALSSVEYVASLDEDFDGFSDFVDEIPGYTNVQQQRYGGVLTNQFDVVGTQVEFGVPGYMDLDLTKNMSELRGVFTRKDYVHRIPCKRAVTLRERYLYVYSSDSHFEGSQVESKIDLSAVVVKSFDEEDLMDVSKLVRVGSPNGFEVVERKKGQVRFWVFTSESRNISMLWVSKLKKVVSSLYKVDLSYFGIDQNFVLPVPPKLPQEFKTNKVSEYQSVRVGVPRLKVKESKEKEYVEPTPDFKHVAQALRKIKEDSSLLYDKCFAKKNELSPKNTEPVKPTLELVHNSEHNAEIPDVSSEASSTISAGRYELPSPKFEERVIKIKREPLTLKCVDLQEFEYSPQVTSPKSIHKFFEECSLKN